ncbi:hypothetical protein AU188_03960 [Mycobacterium sp. IS-3022]|nr:hypothetical protein AU188_03960 [Mycobacterium sp. IS-3022]
MIALEEQSWNPVPSDGRDAFLQQLRYVEWLEQWIGALSLAHLSQFLGRHHRPSLSLTSCFSTWYGTFFKDGCR